MAQFSQENYWTVNWSWRWEQYIDVEALGRLELQRNDHYIYLTQYMGHEMLTLLWQENWQYLFPLPENFQYFIRVKIAAISTRNFKKLET